MEIFGGNDIKSLPLNFRFLFLLYYVIIRQGIFAYANKVLDWGNLLLCCDFEDALGVVNLNFTETLEDTLTEQERSILTLHY